MNKLVAMMSLLSVFGSAHAQDYSAGQIWSYKTRAGEETSTVLINKVESHETLGSIFHISIDGVRVNNPRHASGMSTELPHSPVSEKTLKKSLIKLIGTSAPNPQYIEGYSTWKIAFDSGEAGVFTISVAEIVEVIEEAINK